MGTLGGKIGFLAGIASSFAMLEPMVLLFAGPCVFEGGCGAGENLSLILAAAASLAVGCFVGLIVRWVVNKVAQPKP